MDARILAAEATAKEVLASMPARADAGEALLVARFAAAVPVFRAACRAALAPRKSNAELVTTQEAVHAALVTAVADLRALEFWLATRVPAVSDGNNFGAEVQHHVIEQLKAYRVALAAHMDAMAAYHATRAAALEKLGGSKTSETTAVESTETKVEEGKPKETSVKKLDKTEKSASKEDSEDVVHQVVELDVKQ